MNDLFFKETVTYIEDIPTSKCPWCQTQYTIKLHSNKTRGTGRCDTCHSYCKKCDFIKAIYCQPNDCEEILVVFEWTLQTINKVPKYTIKYIGIFFNNVVVTHRDNQTLLEHKDKNGIFVKAMELKNELLALPIIKIRDKVKGYLAFL